MQEQQQKAHNKPCSRPAHSKPWTILNMQPCMEVAAASLSDYCSAPNPRTTASLSPPKNLQVRAVILHHCQHIHLSQLLLLADGSSINTLQPAQLIRVHLMQQHSTSQHVPARQADTG